MAYPSIIETQEACLALLKALGVNDLDEVVGFVLSCRANEVPTLTVERYADAAIGDKTVAVAASALAPAVQIENVAVED